VNNLNVEPNIPILWDYRCREHG